MTSSANPLGRYDPGGAAQQDVRAVHLLGVPVRVLAASREHHDSLMREFRLLAMSGHQEGVPVQLADLTQTLGVKYAAARARPDAEVDAALERGDATVDLTYQVSAEVAAAARQLETLMREADEFCRSEQLMTLPRTQVMTAFSEWYLQQFVVQVEGGPPRAWDGPLEP